MLRRIRSDRNHLLRRLLSWRLTRFLGLYGEDTADQLVNSLGIDSAMFNVTSAHGGGEARSIAVMIGHGAAGINDTSGVRTKAVPEVPDGGRRSISGPGNDGFGGTKLTQFLGRRKRSGNRRRSCGARRRMRRALCLSATMR